LQAGAANALAPGPDIRKRSSAMNRQRHSMQMLAGRKGRSRVGHGKSEPPQRSSEST